METEADIAVGPRPHGTGFSPAIWQVFAGLFVLLCFSYASVLTQEFLVTDDYALLSAVIYHPLDRAFTPDFELGRWISAYFTDKLVFQWMGDVRNAWIMRLVALAALSGIGTMLFVWLRNHVTWPMAIGVPALMLLSMPFQILSAWVCMMGTLFGLLAVMAAALIFRRIVGFDAEVTVLRSALAFVLIVPLLVFAMGLYESYGLFYWTVLALYLLARLAEGTTTRWQPLAVYGVAGAAAMAVHFAIFKATPFLFGEQLHGRTQTVQSIGDIAARIDWFVMTVQDRVLSFWTVPHVGTLIVSLLFIGISVLTPFWRAASGPAPGRLRALWRVTECYIFVIALYCLAYLPSLVVRESLTRYRTMVPLTPILLFLFLGGIDVALRSVLPDRLARRGFLFALVALTAFAAASANIRVDQLVERNVVDRLYMQELLARMEDQQPIAQGKLVTVVPYANPLADQKLLLEYSYVSSSVNWLVPDMVRVLLHEMGVDASQVEVTVQARGPLPPETVDMRPLRHLLKEGA